MAKKQEHGRYDCWLTRYGFRWGPATVSRIVSDPKWGVVVQVRGSKHEIDIRVTPSGLLRVGPVVTTTLPLSALSDEEADDV